MARNVPDKSATRDKLTLLALLAEFEVLNVIKYRCFVTSERTS
jgi:hypothetical protein